MASRSQHRTNNNKVVKREKLPDPIVNCSDKEVREPRAPRPKGPRARINFIWDWKKEVTSAVANLNIKQTLHVPSWVVRKYLLNKDVVMVRSEDTKFAYCCSVLAPPDRGCNVRYLGDGWYTYLDDHMPEVGDVLLFDVESTRDTMVVKLVRAKDRRRH